MLDLDQTRKERLDARAKAAGRETTEVPIRWRGAVIANLPAEAPLSAFAPLQQVDSEIALLINELLTAAARRGDGATETGMFVLQMLVQRQDLPKQLIAVAREMAEEVIGVDGLRQFLDGKPSPWDVIALVRGALAHWGITLGEASRSTDSSQTDSGGPTSNPTSSGIAEGSISAASGHALALPATSGSAAS